MISGINFLQIVSLPATEMAVPGFAWECLGILADGAQVGTLYNMPDNGKYGFPITAGFVSGSTVAYGYARLYLEDMLLDGHFSTPFRKLFGNEFHDYYSVDVYGTQTRFSPTSDPSGGPDRYLYEVTTYSHDSTGGISLFDMRIFLGEQLPYSKNSLSENPIETGEFLFSLNILDTGHISGNSPCGPNCNNVSIETALADNSCVDVCLGSLLDNYASAYDWYIDADGYRVCICCGYDLLPKYPEIDYSLRQNDIRSIFFDFERDATDTTNPYLIYLEEDLNPLEDIWLYDDGIIRGGEGPSTCPEISGYTATLTDISGGITAYDPLLYVFEKKLFEEDILHLSIVDITTTATISANLIGGDGDYILDAEYIEEIATFAPSGAMLYDVNSFIYGGISEETILISGQNFIYDLLGVDSSREFGGYLSGYSATLVELGAELAPSFTALFPNEESVLFTGSLDEFSISGTVWYSDLLTGECLGGDGSGITGWFIEEMPTFSPSGSSLYDTSNITAYMGEENININSLYFIY